MFVMVLGQAAEIGSMALVIVLVVVAAILFALIPCWILSGKGYDGSAMFGMFLLSFFCSWPIGLCVALIMPDKRTLQGPVVRRPIRRAPPPVVTRRQRQEAATASQEASTPSQASPAGFIQCPRCGQQANAALAACWNCKLPFHGTGPASTPPVVSPGPYRAQFSDTEEVDPSMSMGADASVGMSDFSVGMPENEATPIAAPRALEDFEAPSSPAPPIVELGSKMIKVGCKSCGKRFSGTVAQIAKLKACPRCKAAPFASEPVR
jgi:hypothetical protein